MGNGSADPGDQWLQYLVESCQQHLQGLRLPIAEVAVGVKRVVGPVQPEEDRRVLVLNDDFRLEGYLCRGTSKVQSSENLGVPWMFPFLCKGKLAQ